MIDRIFDVYSSRSIADLDPNYRPVDAVKGSKLRNSDSSALTVLLPTWREGGLPYRVLENRLIMRGSAVLRYSFHDQIIEPNVDRVIESFSTIHDTVVGDIEKLNEKHSYKYTFLLAADLGNVALGLVADELDDFTGAVMINPGSNLAGTMWNSPQTQDLRQAFESDGLDIDYIDRAWSELAPKAHVSAYKDKRVDMLVSLNNTTIPKAYQEEMVEAVTEAGALISVDTTNSGRLASIASYCLRPQLLAA